MHGILKLSLTARQKRNQKGCVIFVIQYRYILGSTFLFAVFESPLSRKRGFPNTVLQQYKAR